MKRNKTIPVLEIGGTHVTAAVVVFCGSWGVRPQSVTHQPLHAQDTAEGLIDKFAQGRSNPQHDGPAEYAVAIPGPFNNTDGTGL